MKHFLISLLFIPLFSTLTSLATVLDSSLFESHASISFPGYTGGETALEEFPVLIEFSPQILPGFRYSDCAENGADLRFSDANGNLIPHEVDTWDPNGTSTLWVRIPSLSNTNTTITAHWGAATADPNFPTNAPSLVWSRYYAVWHINNDLSDSSGNNHNLRATPGVTLDTPSILGHACILLPNAKHALNTTAPITTPSGQALSSFAISAWLRPTQSYADKNARIFSTKPGPYDGYKKNGFEFVLSNNRLIMRGDGANTTHIEPTAWNDHFSLNQWTHAMGVYNGSSARSFFDGIETSHGTIAPITGAGYALGIGNSGGEEPTDNNVFAGSIDEVRIFNGVPSDLWIQNEYASIAHKDTFVAYGPVESTSFYPRLTCSINSIENDSASFTGILTRSGNNGSIDGPDAESVDLYLAVAPYGEPLPPPTRVATNLTEKTTFSFSAPNLRNHTDYHYEITATNSLGIGLRAPLSGFFSTHPLRTLSISQILTENNTLQSVDLHIGGNAFFTNTLFAVYGSNVGGEGRSNWEKCERVAVIPPNPTNLSYTMPDGWGETYTALRFFLVRGRVPDYDTALQYVRTSGMEYFLTDYTPTGSSELEITVRFRSAHANATLFCARGGNTSDRTFSLFYIDSWNIAPAGWRADYNNTPGTPINRPDNETIYTAHMKNGGLSVNNELYVQPLDNPIDFTPPNPLMILASYAGSPSNSIGNIGASDFYGLRAWDNNQLSRNYIPCIRNNTIGIYDTITESFLPTSAGILLEGPTTRDISPSVPLSPETTSTTLRHGSSYQGTFILLQ